MYTTGRVRLEWAMTSQLRHVINLFMLAHFFLKWCTTSSGVRPSRFSTDRNLAWSKPAASHEHNRSHDAVCSTVTVMSTKLTSRYIECWHVGSTCGERVAYLEACAHDVKSLIAS